MDQPLPPGHSFLYSSFSLKRHSKFYISERPKVLLQKPSFEAVTKFGGTLHVMLFLENLIQTLFIFNGLRSAIAREHYLDITTQVRRGIENCEVYIIAEVDATLTKHGFGVSHHAALEVRIHPTFRHNLYPFLLKFGRP